MRGNHHLLRSRDQGIQDELNKLRVNPVFDLVEEEELLTLVLRVWRGSR